MYNLDLAKVNHCLVIAIKLNAAVRRMVGPNSDIKDEIIDMDRELREAASECQRVIKCMAADKGREATLGR